MESKSILSGFMAVTLDSLLPALRAEQSGEKRRDGGKPFAPGLKLFDAIQIKFSVLGSLLREFLETLQGIGTRAGQRGANAWRNRTDAA